MKTTNSTPAPAAVRAEAPMRLGVSSCLLGNPVRFDGGHKHDRWITGELGRYVEFVPVCPEVEAGFGTPREAMRLVGDPAAPRLVTIRSGRDLTETMRAWAARRVEELAGENLCGFVFKSRSPSSGMARVKVYPEKGGMPAHTGVGLFARAFMERFPLIPVEEEGRLSDPRLRENFIERLFVLRAWRDTLARGADTAALIDFHARHKLLAMAHSPALAKDMGRLVAQAASLPDAPDRYEAMLLAAMAKPATVARHVNVLQHMAGYFRKTTTQDERQELAEVIEDYRRGLTPLIVPVTLINHHVRRHGVEYLARQTYLRPHPLELKLRNYY
ncbi:hypothetical protein NNJEOMEG_00449 [Fundidesulfovibrio magnetotacticus]|uniref:DUF1722 domain-containing protein n=1 Tax=Fundidesulfovibrio magnetotacticus TaxID=2730080 RepID=A0A6V8LLP1_9BACT|nr:DUF523 and DUF1722 domain-containing protein [Fundidesulfovibrio magnetotacticus]GFK92624.1 hypothetical protein NNJEOMEG_00449 [Fundidesulfovibrio magnetotacticus]